MLQWLANFRSADGISSINADYCHRFNDIIHSTSIRFIRQLIIVWHDSNGNTFRVINLFNQPIVILIYLQITLVAGGAVMSAHMIFSGVLVLKKDVLPWLKYIFDITFLNHGNDGMVLALFGYNREKLECPELYCHYRDPKDFLKLIDAPANISFHSFVIIFLIVHTVTYFLMSLKLRRMNWRFLCFVCKNWT